ncbi:hypothetical protein A9G11_07105 [Gilliamella sp. wkB108]|uniref:hypothetical protein n=1 Tax=Gilliamella sp. wkB108 TaxID=3120256 RepID=UPI00080E495A|nr:hypothetical protein [Gilliamella apicola]OCG22447.1 hypothetical protein A9G11_07105 [Gilliamella apicola]
MKKILLILLITPFFVIAADEQNLSDQELNSIQDRVIETWKKIVPQNLNEYTVLQDVYKDNNELFLQLSLKNVSKDDFNDETSRATLRRNAITKYCDTSENVNIMLKLSKKGFPNGLSYVYSIGDDKPFVIHVDNSSCQKQ